MRQQEENLPTLDMPEAVAEPPAQMNVGEEVVSVQDVPGPTPEVPEMVPEDAQKVLAGEPLKEPEAKPAEAEGARAIGIASTIMPETGTRTITEEELKAYPMKVQQVVDNFLLKADTNSLMSLPSCRSRRTSTRLTSESKHWMTGLSRFPMKRSNHISARKTPAGRSWLP